MKMKTGYLMMIPIFLFAYSCHCKKGVQENPPDASVKAKAPVIICKTRSDYSDKVSVNLSDDKKQITAYPGITDVLLPLKLHNGYLLLRMTGNAFLSITIDEYGSLKEQPSPEDLFKKIIDTDPFTELYDCRCCALPDTDEINKLIDNGQLQNCKKLK